MSKVLCEGFYGGWILSIIFWASKLENIILTFANLGQNQMKNLLAH